MGKTITIVFLLVVFVFVFGCINGENGQPPEENETGNITNITVIIEEEQNVSIGVNESDGEEIPEEEEEIWEGIEYSYEPNATLGVYFLDTCDYGTGEHGAAIFIKKGDLDILVDAGPAASAGKVVDYLKLRNIDDIDVLISTCADYRRYGGLDDVLDEFEVEEFWWGGEKMQDPEYGRIIDKATAKAKSVRVVERGYETELNGIDIDALNPKMRDRFDDINNDAIVLRVDDRNLTLLLMSNIQTGAQGDLVSEFPDEIKVEIIEAPYYGVGAGTAFIALFLQESMPKYVVIEGCSDETMEVEGSTRLPFKRLMEQEQYEVDYFETYKQGTIRITVDEMGYSIGPG